MLHTELTERIKQGDQNAFELLFRQYHVPLCNYALVFVKHLDVAHEIVQETFIRIWEARYGLDSGLSLKSYLYRSVHNNCINYFKKARVYNRLSEEYQAEIQQRFEILEHDMDDSQFDNMVTEELEQTIQKSIDQLPDHCREIFILSRFHSLSYQQIAEKLSVSVNTVKTQISRALEKIRKNLKII